MNNQIETVKENNLVIEGINQVPTNLFGDTKLKKITSLNLENEEDSNLYLESLDNVPFLKDYVDKEFECVGVTITESIKEFINPDTGECEGKKSHSITFFTSEGKMFVTGSESCYYSLMNIITIKKQMPTREKPMKLMAVNVPAQEKGHYFLKVKVVK